MPFNIKEILYPSDTDQIKWEKVNYNFDQILATGGKEGPKGEKGGTGITGNTGAKGEKGDLGDKGDKGDTGLSTNVWEQFTHSTLDGYVFKPKDGSTTVEPVVVLGDQGYQEGSTDGYLNPDAQLTVETGSGLSYAIKLGASGRYSDPTLSYLAVYGQTDTVEGSAGTRWTIRPHTTGTNTKVLIDTDVIDLSASNKLYLSSANGISISGTGSTTIDTVIIANSTSTFNDDVTIDAADLSINNGGILTVATGDVFFNGTGAVQVQRGTTAQRPIANGTSNTFYNGLIRYNSTTNKFEAFSSPRWLDLHRLSNPEKTTHVSVQADGDYSGSQNDKIVLYANGSRRAIFNESTYNDGGGIINNSAIIDSSLVVTGDVHVNDSGTSTLTGSGVVFKQGEDNSSLLIGGTKAASSGMPRVYRRMNDHLAIWYDINSNNSPLKTGTNTVISASQYDPTTSQFKIEYVKVGWNISVNGYFKIDQTSWPTTAGEQLSIDLGVDYRFPYINNASGHDVLVNVKLLDGAIDGGSTSTFNEVEPLGVDIHGRIPSGDSRIYLWMTKKVWNSGVTPPQIEYIEVPLQTRHLKERDSNPVELMFSFNMPASTASYYSDDGLGTTTGSGGSLPSF